MNEPQDMPDDLAACHTLIREQAATNEKLTSEMEKLRKLLSYFISGHRSEKRILPSPNQDLLPFENSQEFEAARAEAEAQAEAVIQKYTVERKIQPKKRRDESLPSHLRREEQIMEAAAAVKTCETHGERKLIGYDTTETLVYQRPELFVRVKKYPKYACVGNSECGVESPERPTSLVEGDRFDTSVAAVVVEAKWFHHLPIYRHQDLFAGSGWTPSRSTLLNLVDQVEFVIDPLIAFMTRAVQEDIGVGFDETNCRMLLPKEPVVIIPGDLKSQRLAEKVAEAKEKGANSLLAKMWAYSGLHLAPYNVFDFRVSRHRDGPDEFFRPSRCKVLGDCFSGNRSVVIQSDDRLEFVACWGHARRKFVEATSYQTECEKMLGMIQALYDIETRAKELTWQDRQSLRMQDSRMVLDSIGKWLDSRPLQDVLPKSDFAEAIGYLRNHWAALTVYVTDGRIPIDNVIASYYTSLA